MKRKKKAVDVPLPEGLAFGIVVQWYDEGWRQGFLHSVKGQIATIRHPTKGKIKVRLDEIKPWEKEVRVIGKTKAITERVNRKSS